MSGHIGSSENLHWNTPEDIKEPVWGFFNGPPDLDPASNSTSIMGAEVNYVLPHNDGLSDPWAIKGEGTKVWLNPPFGRSYMKPDRSDVIGAKQFQSLREKDEIVAWLVKNGGVPPEASTVAGKKLAKSLKKFLQPDSEYFDPSFHKALYGDGNQLLQWKPISSEYSVHTSIYDWTFRCQEMARLKDLSIICLLPAATDTAQWQEIVFKSASKICFVQGRIAFLDSNGKPGGPCPMAMAMVYWGPAGDDFKRSFKDIGEVR